MHCAQPWVHRDGDAGQRLGKPELGQPEQLGATGLWGRRRAHATWLEAVDCRQRDAIDEIGKVGAEVDLKTLKGEA